MFSRWREQLRHTLGVRLALWYALIFLVSTLSVAALTYSLVAYSLQQRDREIVAGRVREYAIAYRQGGLDAVATAVQREQAAGPHERLFVRVIGPLGSATFFSLPPEWGEFDLDTLGAGGTTGTEWMAAPARSGEARLEIASLASADGTVVQVGKTTAGREALLGTFRGVLGSALLLVAVLAIAGAVLLTRSALRPIRDLLAVVRRVVRTGEVGERVPIHRTGDLLEELGTLVNRMLDRISTLVEGMRGALDHVAHDLRTPMARLRGQAEAALRRTDDPAAMRAALERCVDETDRVLSLLDVLMDVSEAETGTMHLQIEPVDVATLVAEACDLYADVAEDKGVRLDSACPATVSIRADGRRLRQVLANLLDNAIKYTPSGGRVRVEGRVDGDRVRILVEDTGVGIPAGELPRIWDRLYRGAAAGSERGLGVGLTLVRAVVRAHGGHVDVDSAPGRGSRFTVVLPVDGA